MNKGGEHPLAAPKAALLGRDTVLSLPPSCAATLWVYSFAHPGSGAFGYPAFPGLGGLCKCKMKHPRNLDAVETSKGLLRPAMKLSCLGNDEGYSRSVRTSVLSLHKVFLGLSRHGTLSDRQRS